MSVWVARARALILEQSVVPEPAPAGAPHGGNAMQKSLNESERSDRIESVRRIFEDQGFGNLELLEGWEGDELEELRELLTEQEFETLLDQLSAGDPDAGG